MNDLTIHCIVKNEEKWIWYALSSILKIADQALIFDTGSTDKSVEIIKTFKNKKIIFEQKGEVNPAGLTRLRIEQLKRTKTEWLLILDGDEIWPNKTAQELISVIKKADRSVYGAVIRAWNAVGDIYHYHPESTKYHWPFAPKNYFGWANLRLIRTSIPNLSISGDYPLEAYIDDKGTPIQNHGSKHLVFLKNRYFHTTYLVRSESRNIDKGVLNRAKKGKLEFGIAFPKNFQYPEVFYQRRPSIVFSPWEKRSVFEASVALPLAPIREARRKLLGLYGR